MTNTAVKLLQRQLAEGKLDNLPQLNWVSNRRVQCDGREDVTEMLGLSSETSGILTLFGKGPPARIEKDQRSYQKRKSDLD